MNYSWQERAFDEDSARILSGSSMWPPRFYSCTFCRREFNSAQALGGHMNIHRRERATLKQNLTPHHNKNDYFKTFLGNHHHHHEISTTQLDCGLSAYYSSPSTTITTTRLTKENCGQNNFSSPYSSSILGHMGSCNSEPEGVVNAREFGYDNYVETSLSVGLASSMFGQKSSSTTTICGDRTHIDCKRLENLIHKTCSSVEFPLALNHHGMEELDLELRLGKQQKFK